MRSSCEGAPHTWANRIVPLGADHVMFHLQCFHDGVGDPFAGFVNVRDQAGRDPQACRGRCATQIAQHRLQGPQGLPRPIQTNVLTLTDFLGGEEHRGLTAAGGEAILGARLGRVYNLPLTIGLRRIASCSASYGFPPSWTSFLIPCAPTFTGTIGCTSVCWSWQWPLCGADGMWPTCTGTWMASTTGPVSTTFSWWSGGIPRQPSARRLRNCCAPSVPAKGRPST